MNETKRRRLAVIWIAFAAVMAYYALGDGFDASLGDLVGMLAGALGLGLAAMYYLNPGDVLSFGAD